MTQAGFIVPKSGLETLGLKNLGTVHWNLTVPALYEEAIRRSCKTEFKIRFSGRTE